MYIESVTFLMKMGQKSGVNSNELETLDLQRSYRLKWVNVVHTILGFHKPAYKFRIASIGIFLSAKLILGNSVKQYTTETFYNAIKRQIISRVPNAEREKVKFLVANAREGRGMSCVLLVELEGLPYIRAW